MNIKFIDLVPSNFKSGELNLPGSKSISNRVLLLSALSRRRYKYKKFIISDDTKIMINALKKLGINISENSQLKECTIKGPENNYF